MNYSIEKKFCFNLPLSFGDDLYGSDDGKIWECANDKEWQVHPVHLMLDIMSIAPGWNTPNFSGELIQGQIVMPSYGLHDLQKDKILQHNWTEENIIQFIEAVYFHFLQRSPVECTDVIKLNEYGVVTKWKVPDIIIPKNLLKYPLIAKLGEIDTHAFYMHDVINSVYNPRWEECLH